ncbi:MAG: Holliday junction branch migration DNA helicase RuvB [bacterium]|jgi:Holliday junction DNA helicase RuvB|nr:Holliday junction branch migration DNA helicase RuvB [candidate division KSB1 bacterium]MDH7560085.1 Holliday junction branch migration DNA helicase RuvB [bacterium]
MAVQRHTVDRATNPGRLDGEIEFDTALRPTSFDEFVGQKKLVDNLKVFIQAAKQRGEPLDHCLFYGPPGLGKTTLANIIAHEMGVNIRCTSGPALERPLDLVGLLSRLEERDVLFIDEVHRLSRVVEEYLYPALEEFQVDIIIDKGPNARSVRLKLPPFTMIGATTRAGSLTSPLRSRFGVTNRLDYYKPEELFQIIKRSARILEIGLDEEAGLEIARRSRGTPRVANRLLRRVRDFAQVEGLSRITLPVTLDALRRLEVDELGLDEMDKRIVCTVIEKFKGGPVGLNTLAVAVGEDGETIEEVYEPYLVQEGFIDRTARGRTATERAFAHFGFKQPQRKQESLF